MEQRVPLSVKLTTRALCQRHSIDILQLSRESGIDALIIWDVFVGNSYKREVIGALLCTINRIVGTSYTLDTIRIM